MATTPDILTTFLVAIVFYILGRATEKAKWIEKSIDLSKLKQFFKKEKDGVFEE